MPAETQLRRDDKPIELRWGWWHIGCLQDAILSEADRVYAETGEPMEDTPSFYMGLLNGEPYRFKYQHRYEDQSDGEVFIILPGDVYAAWRSM